MPRGRSNRGRPSRASRHTTASINRRVNQLLRSRNGHPLKPPADPPSIVYQPWNHATIQVNPPDQTKAVSIIKINDVHNAAVLQLGLLSGQKCIYRIRSVRLWCLSPTRPIQGIFTSILTDATDSGVVLVDYPSPNHFARIGYAFPSTGRINNISGTGQDVLFEVNTTKANTPWIAYVDLLWKSETTPPFDILVATHPTTPPHSSTPDYCMVSEELA